MNLETRDRKLVIEPEPGNYHVEEVTNHSRFLELKEEWNELLENSFFDIPFLRHEWFCCWLNAFGQGAPLHVFLVRFNGRLVCALPLVETVERMGPFKLVVWQSMSNTHSLRFYPIVGRERLEAVQVLWNHLKNQSQKWNVIILKNLRLDLKPHRCLQEVAKQSGCSSEIWYSGQSASLEIKADWSSYESKLNRSFRKNLRQNRRRLSETGNVTHEIFETRRTVTDNLPDAFRVEQSGWKGRKGSAIGCSPRLVAFYTNWAQIAAENGWMRLSLLRCDGEAAAFEYGVEYRRAMYSMKIGYNEEKFRRYSAGQLMIQDTLQSCFRSGADRYEFLGPLSDAQSSWKPETSDIGWLWIFNRTLSSRLLHFYKFRVKTALKYLKEKMQNSFAKKQ